MYFCQLIIYYLAKLFQNDNQISFIVSHLELESKALDISVYPLSVSYNSQIRTPIYILNRKDKTYNLLFMIKSYLGDILELH